MVSKPDSSWQNLPLYADPDIWKKTVQEIIQLTGENSILESPINSKESPPPPRRPARLWD